MPTPSRASAFPFVPRHQERRYHFRAQQKTIIRGSRNAHTAQRTIGAASHFLGEGELIQHFGLGTGFDLEADTVHRVEVEWPASGIVQGFDELGGGQTLLVVEGEP
ncbi:ASPIC/UnbV domain-containing protein [Enhygromyxa salina]|uniref:ASPIC/UnbV domain-containing protein n=1 Tax=Enhygromyxa salina TaxID=215803 RepID=UPI0015E61B41|nr:ASPIC/UnbV domain-containing protein [Enhygromyxa salina]